MNLNELENKLRTSAENRIEYYDNGKKWVKKFSEVYIDVLKARSFLKANGFVRGQRVAIIGKNAYEWILVDIACLLTGIVTVPMETTGKFFDPENGFEAFGIDALFTNLPQYISANHPRIFSFDQVLDPADQRTGADQSFTPAVCYAPDDIFTIIFTSGTSGRSKAIEVRKKSFDHLISGTQSLYNFGAGDRFLVFLPLSIYLERCYVYSAILLGFDVILTPFEYIFHAIQNDKPTIIIGVPFFFENFQEKFNEKINSKFIYKTVFGAYNFLVSIGLGFVFKNRFSPFLKAWGGHARYLLTGSAPIKKDTLLFYKKMGITLYEGYGMSEIGGMITLNSPGQVKLGSVGKVFPGKEVFTDDEGQIIVRCDLHANNCYFRAQAGQNEEVYIDTNSVATGDIGYIDKDGFVFINGRKKDIIVTSLGKKNHPVYIEEILSRSGLFANVIVFGNDKPFLVAMLVPKRPSITANEVKEAVNNANLLLSPDEKILRYFTADTPFSIENEMLTTSLKVNRKKIESIYYNDIEKLYK